MAPILGLSPFASAHDLWRELRGMHRPSAAPHMIRGNACEPHLAQRVATLMGCDLSPVEPVLHPHGIKCMRVKGDYWWRGTKTMMELKSSAHFANRQWDGPPAYYHVQAVIEMWANNAEHCILPVLVVPPALIEAEGMLIDEPDLAYVESVLNTLAPLMVRYGALKFYHVEADPEFAESLVSHVQAWWDRHIVGGEEPAVTATRAFDEYARDTFEERLPLRDASEDEARLMAAFVEARALESAAKAKKEDAGAALRNAIGAAQGLYAPGVGMAKAKATSPKVDWQALALERGTRLEFLGQTLDDIPNHTRDSGGGRTMTVTAEKKART